MITKLLNEVNEKIEKLNNLVQDKEYFKKLEERIEKVNNYAQEQKQEIARLNKMRQQVIDELFELKDMIYKPETREINFDVQRKISSMIVKLGDDKE